MKTFLSIDIDYWNNIEHSLNKDNPLQPKVTALTDFLQELTDKARERNIPISAVMNHQQMLPKVNRSEARTVINIDTHSDFVDTTVTELNCGTWLAYVHWRHEGNYFWIHASSADEGECNGDAIIFSDRGPTRGLSDWFTYDHQRRETPIVDELLKECIEICVCSSPAYSYDELIRVFHVWRKKNNISYQKGLCDEQHGRVCCPSYFKNTVVNEVKCGWTKHDIKKGRIRETSIPEGQAQVSNLFETLRGCPSHSRSELVS